MPAARCRHRSTWVLACRDTVINGAWLWCYACGALRREDWKRWVKPTGDPNDNPWERAK